MFSFTSNNFKKWLLWSEFMNKFIDSVLVLYYNYIGHRHCWGYDSLEKIS